MSTTTTPILLGTAEHDTPQWDEIRSHGLGGSEIAAVVGLSPYVSRFALWHRKRGLIGKQTVNMGMDWGHRLEPIVCDAWAESRPEYHVERCGTYRHGERSWQLANPDRLLFRDGRMVGFLEVKTANGNTAWEWGHGPEDVPPYYRTQALWYADVLGFDEAHMAVLIGGADYREYRIAVDPAETQRLREAGAEFWQSVLDNIRPDLDGHDATYEAVREMHPDIDRGDEIELDEALYVDYSDARAAYEAAKTEHQLLKSTVLDVMGNAQYAAVGERRVLRRQATRGAVALHPVKQPKETAA